MLLRAGLLYILGVASLLLGALAAWQGLQLASLKDGAVTFSERTARTQRDLDAARLEAEMAQRRALVAEDKLTRAGTAAAGDGASGQPGAAAADSAEVETLRRDLADTQRERDAARTEAHELAGELAAMRSAGERSGAGQDAEAAREQINKLSNELEEARRSILQTTSARNERDAARTESAQHARERDAARADVQKLSDELEIARAEVLRLSGALEAANKTLAEANHASRDVKDAQAAGGAAPATQAGTGSLGVTEVPVAPAAVTAAPVQTPAKTVSIDPTPQVESESPPRSTTGVTDDAASAAPETRARKRKEAKRKKHRTPGRHIESSVFLPF
ncbi:MAG: hypothetical protein JNL45_15215 [Hyphomicrobium sp.]|nr:hypothetical protein [Hyphomicrobium sp.]